MYNLVSLHHPEYHFPSTLVIGIAARVKPRQALITVRTNREYIKQTMVALKKAAPKIPTPCKIVFDKIDPELRRKLGYGVA